MMDQGIADLQTDKALGIEFQHLFTKHIRNITDGVELEKGFERNQC